MSFHVEPNRDIHNTINRSIEPAIYKKNYLGRIVRWMREDLSTLQSIGILFCLFATGIGIIADIAMGFIYKAQKEQEKKLNNKIIVLISEQRSSAKTVSDQNIVLSEEQGDFMKIS